MLWIIWVHVNVEWRKRLWLYCSVFFFFFNRTSSINTVFDEDSKGLSRLSRRSSRILHSLRKAHSLQKALVLIVIRNELEIKMRKPVNSLEGLSRLVNRSTQKTFWSFPTWRENLPRLIRIFYRRWMACWSFGGKISKTRLHGLNVEASLNAFLQLSALSLKFFWPSQIIHNRYSIFTSFLMDKYQRWIHMVCYVVGSFYLFRLLSAYVSWQLDCGERDHKKERSVRNFGLHLSAAWTLKDCKVDSLRRWRGWPSPPC